MSLTAAVAAAVGALASNPVLTASSNGTFLELTAIVTRNNISALECWRLTDPFVTSADAGTAGASTMDINDLANATYTVLPPRFEGGVHNSPHPQLVIFLSGVAHVTLPFGTDDALVLGGGSGMIIAADTTGSGHNTSYPSNQQTRALQIPFTDGVIPPHVVVNEGACTGDQIVTTTTD
ncbi:uncharacterized protein PHACADRAFT_262071 [Phanerochaete carnosa HHB-10118-sp]|uniref:Uncharacterized protein n=1 Tax=Phanerochaete carnosa (strain HHB-10118-sp) TaxID=650164 RepID=K5VYR3_PHACS|nr:uncharacterized protein PHACADRAFT_262071 [Phanerochaete carnosa HHB-10118-sp]EKM51749.1 hypothetical protein PHACADRAFT_262071 [Phanerochaete carnosa HHB-10118-sp]